MSSKTQNRSNPLELLVALSALAVAAAALVIANRSDRREVTAREASKVVKAAAEDQHVDVELTDEQMAAIREQWDVTDPSRPADINFVVEDRPEANLRVASYSYMDSTCCA